MSASVQSFCHVLFWLLMVTERPLMVRTVAAPSFWRLAVSLSETDTVTVLEADRRKLYSQSNERLRGLT